MDEVQNEYMNCVEQLIGIAQRQPTLYDKLGELIVQDLEIYVTQASFNRFSGDYLMVLLRFLGTWPKYEYHITLGKVDPVSIKLIYDHVEAINDMVDPNDASQLDKWTINNVCNITKYRDIVRSSMALSA